MKILKLIKQLEKKIDENGFKIDSIKREIKITPKFQTLQKHYEKENKQLKENVLFLEKITLLH